MQPFKCPVCEGRQSLPGNFYSSMTPYSSWSVVSGPVECRSCEGTGIVWTPEYEDEEEESASSGILNPRETLTVHGVTYRWVKQPHGDYSLEPVS